MTRKCSLFQSIYLKEKQNVIFLISNYDHPKLCLPNSEATKGVRELGGDIQASIILFGVSILTDVKESKNGDLY